MSKRNIIIVLAVAIVLVVVLVFVIPRTEEIETLPVLIEEEETMIPEFPVPPVEEVIEQEVPMEGEELMPAN